MEKAPGKFETEVPGGTVIASPGPSNTTQPIVISFCRSITPPRSVPFLNELRSGHSERGRASSGVEFRELYPGISVKLENTRGRLIVRFRLAPGARPDDIAVCDIGGHPAFIGENGALDIFCYPVDSAHPNR